MLNEKLMMMDVEGATVGKPFEGRRRGYESREWGFL
jgi:hypothetical protein